MIDPAEELYVHNHLNRFRSRLLILILTLILIHHLMTIIAEEVHSCSIQFLRLLHAMLYSNQVRVLSPELNLLRSSVFEVPALLPELLLLRCSSLCQQESRLTYSVLLMHFLVHVRLHALIRIPAVHVLQVLILGLV